jgi:urocanate hydratase
VTEQTAAHDPLVGYVPRGPLARRGGGAAQERSRRLRRAREGRHGRGGARDARDAERGAFGCDYGNNIRAHAVDVGVERAFDIPGFVPAYIRPLFCEGKGPFRWVALSGDPEDIAVTDACVKEVVPMTIRTSTRWIDMAKERVAFQGLPARICWLGYGDRQAWASRSTSSCAGQGQGAHRDRPRSPRLRLGRVAQPRDRGDEGRLRRHRRLGDPQRARQHRGRRERG